MHLISRRICHADYYITSRPLHNGVHMIGCSLLSSSLKLPLQSHMLLGEGRGGGVSRCGLGWARGGGRVSRCGLGWARGP